MLLKDTESGPVFAAGSSMATRLETHKRAEYLGSKAVLVAIAIPVFTTQLERNHEATDLANIRNAYAETMTDFIADGAAIVTKTSSIKQRDTAWYIDNKSTLPVLTA